MASRRPIHTFQLTGYATESNEKHIFAVNLHKVDTVTLKRRYVGDFDNDFSRDFRQVDHRVQSEYLVQLTLQSRIECGWKITLLTSYYAVLRQNRTPLLSAAVTALHQG